jgi:hypothetical protein
MAKKSPTTDAEDHALAKQITITRPNFQTLAVRITGKTPYLQHRFWKKGDVMHNQEQGSTAKGKKAKPARDFVSDFKAAQHRSAEGWCGIPCPAFRNAMIDACRLVQFEMTRAKMAVFCEEDGIDIEDGTPLVKILAAEPEMSTMMVRNATGVVDIRARPMWRTWAADVRIFFDADQFTPTDVVNLLMRAGMQVGVGEGRPFSKKSAGLGFGTFTVEQSA